MELNIDVVPAVIDDSSETDTDSYESENEVVLTFDVPEPGEVDLNLSQGDGDSDEEWYEPLTFQQMVRVFIGVGIIATGSISLVIALLCKLRKPSSFNRVRVAPEHPSPDLRITIDTGDKIGSGLEIELGASSSLKNLRKSRWTQISVLSVFPGFLKVEDPAKTSRKMNKFSLNPRSAHRLRRA